MKKFLTLILSLTLIFSAFTFVACGGEGTGSGGGDAQKVDVIEGTVGLTYKINGQGSEQYATFTGLSKSCTATEIVVASHYNGVLVTQIGTGYSVLSNFDNVEKITVHKYVNVINASAFWKSESLKEVHFDKDGVLDKVGSTAFKDCAKLEVINLPSKVYSLGDEAFIGCDSLKGKEYEGAEYIGGTSNPYFILVKGKDGATTCKVNANCQLIYANAFLENTKIETVTFESEENLTAIGYRAFYGATSLKSIKIPRTCTSIAVEAFQYCTSLETLEFAKNSSMSLIGERAFSECTALKQIVNFEETNIPTLTKQVFHNCSSLVSITIPNTVTHIDMWAVGVLNGKSSLETVIFEKGSQLKSIHQHCFRNNTKLTSIIIPKSVQTIDKFSFVSTGRVTGYFGAILYMEGDMERDTFRKGWNSSTSYTGEVPPDNVVWCPTYFYSETYKEGCWRYVNGEPVVW